MGGKSGTNMMGKMMDKMKTGNNDSNSIIEVPTCGAGLCCGIVLKSGVWGTDLVCNQENAITFNDYNFQCK